MAILRLRRSAEDFRDHLRDPEDLDRAAADDLPGTPVTNSLLMQPLRLRSEFARIQPQAYLACLIAETLSRGGHHSGSQLRVIQQPVPLTGTVICRRIGDMLSDHATRPEERLHRRQH
jgi:hypothetical protein